MSDRLALARQALRGAMQLRRNLAIPREAPVNAFDVADMVGADVRFLDAPSLEGMLVRDPGLRVLLPSTQHRPMGRILFSCAHEVGHHYMGHGTRVDSYIEGAEDGRHTDEEFLADSFAGHLLMPRPAVLVAFARRQWDPATLSAAQAYVVAGELGVGYGTLLHHMDRVLRIVPSAHRQELDKSSPKRIRERLLGKPCPERLLVADAAWCHVPLDAEVGELLMLPKSSGDNCPLLSRCDVGDDHSLYMAATPGESRLTLACEIVVRVARKHYVGPLSNRYLEDPDEHATSNRH